MKEATVKIISGKQTKMTAGYPLYMEFKNAALPVRRRIYKVICLRKRTDGDLAVLSAAHLRADGEFRLFKRVAQISVLIDPFNGNGLSVSRLLGIQLQQICCQILILGNDKQGILHPEMCTDGIKILRSACVRAGAFSDGQDLLYLF